MAKDCWEKHPDKKPKPKPKSQSSNPKGKSDKTRNSSLEDEVEEKEVGKLKDVDEETNFEQ